jgi:hypothetical protein
MTNDSIPVNDTTREIPFENFSTYMQPTEGEFARPYDSTNGIPKDVQYVVMSVIVVFFIYVLIRVRHVWNKGLPNKK